MTARSNSYGHWVLSRSLQFLPATAPYPDADLPPPQRLSTRGVAVILVSPKQDGSQIDLRIDRIPGQVEDLDPIDPNLIKARIVAPVNSHLVPLPVEVVRGVGLIEIPVYLRSRRGRRGLDL